MDSLFTKIFVAFWLAALLLAGSVLAAQRIYGGDIVKEAETRLSAQAGTAAALWEAGGPHAVERWLRRFDRRSRPVLVDAQGEPVLRQQARRHLEQWLPRNIEPGVHRLAPRRLAVVAQLPAISPPLYLVSRVHPHRFQLLPLWARFVIAILITGIVSFGLSALLTHRLRRLRVAARALADGDLEARVSIRGGDEVAALAQDFNLMAERINALLASQRQLVRDVSHELRSPLARLRIALELAERADSPKKPLARIEKEADELEQLITGLLSLSRLESGQGILEKQTIALDELLRSVVQDADYEARARNRRVEVSGLDKVLLRGDRVLLRGAIENVIRNAVRYTHEGTAVQVHLARPETGIATISVLDEGPGVPQKALQTLFEPFTRVGDARDRQRGGYGLGLAISGRTVEAHGGSIHASNRPQGGLEVVITLPLG